MATERVVRAAVDRAVGTATVDADAPPGEQCRFDPDALAGVIRYCDSGRNSDLVTGVVDRVLQGWVDALEVDRALAATVLRTRIAAATVKHQVVVENLQGDVGAGRGSQRPFSP